MGTINTSEVAKKNPMVYCEMVQQKSELDLAALESSRNLSLFYLESYARENNLTTEEKNHIACAIDERVYTEAGGIISRMWKALREAIKRLWNSLFGKGSPEVKEEDMNNKVKADFNINGVESAVDGIKGKLDALVNNKDKDKSKSISDELSTAIDRLKTITAAGAGVYVTLSVATRIKEKIGGVVKHIEGLSTTAQESFEKAREDCKSKLDKVAEDNAEERKKINEEISALEQMDREVNSKITQVISELSTLAKNVDKLIESNSSDESSKDGENADSKDPNKEEDNDASRYGGSGGSGSGSSSPTSNDPFINWINKYHYKYTANDYSSKKVPAEYIEGENSGNPGDVYIKNNIMASSDHTFTYKEIEDVVRAAAAHGTYKVGVDPDKKITENGIESNLGPALGKDFAKKIVLGKLINMKDIYHVNSKVWGYLTNPNILKLIQKFTIDKGGSGWTSLDDWKKTNLTNKKSKKSGGGYVSGLTEDENNFIISVVNIFNLASSDGFGIWKSMSASSIDRTVKYSIRGAIGLNSGDPDPVYYT